MRGRMENTNYSLIHQGGTMSRRGFSKSGAALTGALWAGTFVKGQNQSVSASNERIACELVHGSMQRRYILELAPNHDRREPAPLILFFHGGGGDAELELQP